MARIDTLTNFLTDVAAAIKNKTGKTDMITPANFDTEIESIQAGGGDTSIEDEIISRSISVDYVNNRVDKIGSYAFSNCSNLTSVSSSSVLSIGGSAFSNCSKLTSAIFHSVTTIESYAFQQCPVLAIADFPLVITIGDYAFRYCSKLTSASFPLVTTTGMYTFGNCTDLTIADFPSLKKISNYLFQDCPNLTSINFPLATSIGTSSFQNCSKLTSASFPLVTTINANSFKSCTMLDTLILRSETVAKLSNISAFTSTPIANGTGYVYVPSALIEEYKVATNWTTYADQFRAIEDYPDICGEATE